MLILSVAPAPQWEPQLWPRRGRGGCSGCRVEDQLPGQIVGHGGICGAGKAAEQLDAGLHQRHLRTGADAAAEHNICAMLYEKACQCAVA